MFGVGHRIGRDERGGVAVIFALALVPLIGVAGAAADYWQAASMRSELQKSADAAALVAARGTEPFADRQRAALALLDGSVHTPAGVGLRPTIVPVMRDGREVAVSVTLTGTLPTSFLRLAGIDGIDVAVEAEATAGRNELFEIAFVLDTTDSMEGDRLTALKATTTDLIEDFKERRGSEDQIRVSVIPFGRYVNIGTHFRGSPWLDVPADYQNPVRRECRMEQEVVARVCTRVWDPPRAAQARTCFNDGRPYECGTPARDGRWRDQCTNVRGPNLVERCNNRGGDWVRWHGCVGSRDLPRDTRDSDYGTPIPGLMSIRCGSPILEATDDLDGAIAKINGLTTDDETFIPAGLIWGWRALSTQAPLSARAGTADAPVRRYMVLVTDGRNTVSPTYPTHGGSNGATADTLMRETCVNMAADDASDITLYTIAFEVEDAGVKTLLEDCSSMNGGAFFDAANADELAEAMQEIGGRISVLRLTN